jgi:hypothetical protein
MVYWGHAASWLPQLSKQIYLHSDIPKVLLTQNPFPLLILLSVLKVAIVLLTPLGISLSMRISVAAAALPT